MISLLYHFVWVFQVSLLFVFAMSEIFKCSYGPFRASFYVLRERFVRLLKFSAFLFLKRCQEKILQGRCASLSNFLLKLEKQECFKLHNKKAVENYCYLLFY